MSGGQTSQGLEALHRLVRNFDQTVCKLDLAAPLNIINRVLPVKNKKNELALTWTSQDVAKPIQLMCEIPE